SLSPLCWSASCQCVVLEGDGGGGWDVLANLPRGSACRGTPLFSLSLSLSLPPLSFYLSLLLSLSLARLLRPPLLFPSPPRPLALSFPCPPPTLLFSCLLIRLSLSLSLSL